MNFKVGVFAKGQISGEAISEAKKVLNELALKYKCRFELSKESEEEEETINAKAKSTFKANARKGSQAKNGAFLSFGGELEF